MSMYLLLQCDWQVVINKLPCFFNLTIILGAILVAIFLFLKYWINPCIKNCHEKKMKEKALLHEMWWDIEKEKKKSSTQEEGEYKGPSKQKSEIERMKYQLDELTKKYFEMRDLFTKQSKS